MAFPMLTLSLSKPHKVRDDFFPPHLQILRTIKQALWYICIFYFPDELDDSFVNRTSALVPNRLKSNYALTNCYILYNQIRVTRDADLRIQMNCSQCLTMFHSYMFSHIQTTRFANAAILGEDSQTMVTANCKHHEAIEFSIRTTNS